jgi:hypothetical protein
MPATIPWEHRDGLVYEKEILPVGNLVRWAGDNKEVQHIDVKRAFLNKVVSQFKKFKEVGVRVPLFKTHEEDPDNDRGTVEDVFVKKNAKGFDSLFAKVKFHNEAARDLGLNNDVSVLCPPKFVDGKGNHYSYPLRHLALTSKPIAPGLQNFEPIMLSFSTESGLSLAEPSSDPPPQENETMNEEVWKKLLALLKITPTPEQTPDDQLNAIVAAVENLVGGEETPPDGEPPVELSYSPVLGKQMIKSRELIISNLLAGETPVITPAIAKSFKERFCTEATVKSDLALSEGDGETEFDRAVELAQSLATNRPLAPTGRKTIKLGEGDNEPATVRNARKRAEAAKAGRR